MNITNYENANFISSELVTKSFEGITNIDPITILIDNSEITLKRQTYIDTFRYLEFQDGFAKDISNISDLTISIKMINYPLLIYKLPKHLKNLDLIKCKENIYNLPNNLEYFRLNNKKGNTNMWIPLPNFGGNAFNNVNDINNESHEQQIIEFNDNLKEIELFEEKDCLATRLFPNSVEILTYNGNFNVKDNVTIVPTNLKKLTYYGNQDLIINNDNLTNITIDTNNRINIIDLRNCTNLDYFKINNDDEINKSFINAFLPSNIRTLIIENANLNINSLINSNNILNLQIISNNYQSITCSNTLLKLSLTQKNVYNIDEIKSKYHLQKTLNYLPLSLLELHCDAVNVNFAMLPTNLRVLTLINYDNRYYDKKIARLPNKLIKIIGIEGFVKTKTMSNIAKNMFILNSINIIRNKIKNISVNNLKLLCTDDNKCLCKHKNAYWSSINEIYLKRDILYDENNISRKMLYNIYNDLIRNTTKSINENFRNIMKQLTTIIRNHKFDKIQSYFQHLIQNYVKMCDIYDENVNERVTDISLLLNAIDSAITYE